MYEKYCIALEHIDVEAALVAANAGGWRWADYGDSLETRFFRALGMTDESGNAEPTGAWRRFAAGLSSVTYRRDGNTCYHLSRIPLKQVDTSHIPSGVANNDPVGAFVLTWWSDGGTWGQRAWRFEGTIVVCMDDCGQTSIEFCQDSNLVVVGNGGASEFFGITVGQLLSHAVHGLLARHQLRLLIEKDWQADAPLEIGTWLEMVTADRDYVLVSDSSAVEATAGEPADNEPDLATREGMGRRQP
jgi:hypothetical protein